MNKSTIPESKRTVIFTEEEARFIHEIEHSFGVDDAVDALEEITNTLLNHPSQLHNDIGNHYFLLRQLREFHAKLIGRLAPVGEAYNELLFNT